MEPIDFSQPAPGQQGPAPRAASQWLLRAMHSRLVLALLALAAWAALAAAFERLRLAEAPGAAISWEGPLGTVLDMAWPGLQLLIWPIIVVGVFFHLRGMFMRKVFSEAPSYRESDASLLSESEEEARESAASYRLSERLMAVFWEISLPIALKFAFLACTGLALLAAAFAVAAHVKGEDPWEAVPWANANLGEFIARHPGLSVERDADRTSGVALSDGQGHSIIVNGWDLRRAQALFEPCPPGIGAGQLGGIPPYPGAPCATLLRLRKAGAEQLTYFFGIAKGGGEATVHAIKAHFKPWSDAQGSGSAGYFDGERHIYYTGSNDGKWRIEVESRDGGATSILFLQKP